MQIQGERTMPFEEPVDSGARLGADAVDHVSRCAEQYCAAECERMTLANEPRLNVLRIEGRDLTERAERLEEEIRKLPKPAGDLESRKRKAHFYWTVGILLILAAFAFTVI